MKRTQWGVLVTALYLLAAAAVVYWKRDTLYELPLNAIGDFLAGAFGPLAFLWLVLGYLQQGDQLEQNSKALLMQAEELKQGNDALLLQAKELRNSVEQQRELVEVTRRQVELDLENIKYERSRIEAAGLPRFSMTSTRKSRTSNGCVYEVLIRNLGNLAEEVMVVLTCEGDGASVYQAPSAVSGETLRFTFNVEGNGVLPEHSRFVIMCLDYQAREFSESFEVETLGNFELLIQKVLPA